ncbi:MAG: hypothetical protein LBD14_05165 [Puniceicoccales bacterium]|jgi:predicted nucleic acid-binding Zn ribbon protein|nr:hypothetical protein [Puniceicoccales bacterium]
MPVYTYQLLDGGGVECGLLEIEQGINEPALTCHPLTGQPMRRVIRDAPYLTGPYGERRVRAQISNPDNLGRLGWTRYEKDRGTGKYVRTSGKDARAPEILDPGKLQNGAGQLGLSRESKLC